MRYTRMGLLAALAVLAMPLAIAAQAHADSSAPSGKCKLAPDMSLHKVSDSNCGGPFIAGHAVSKVKTVDRANTGNDTGISSGGITATMPYHPPADPVVEKVKSSGKSQLTSLEPAYIDNGSDRLYVCTGATESNYFASVARAVGSELPLGRQPCQRTTSEQ